MCGVSFATKDGSECKRALALNETRYPKLGKLVLSFVRERGRVWLTGIIPVTCTLAIQGWHPVFAPP